MKWDFLLEAGIILILANQLTNALKGQCKAHKIFSRIILRSNLEEDWTSHDDFLSCLVEADMKAKRRYFFPNHDGGKALPKSLRKIIDENVARYDLPELDELDNLHQPEKSLKFSQEMASYLYGSSKSFYLVNGSTGGILIAMYALRTIFQRKFRISHTPCRFLIARTAHKSVFDGLKLLDCESILLPVYVEPDFNVPFNIDDDLLHQTLSANKEKICGVVFTRPTYQGVYNGKAALASQIEICHLHGVPVLVDEAHGAHLRFVDGQDAVSCGADLVVQSSHKGLMALSQTGLLHIGKDLHRVVNLPVKEIERIIQDSFSSFTTTSPNSLLLASLHASIKYFAEGGGLQIRQDVEYITELKDRLDFNPFTRLLDRSPAISRDRLFVDPFKLNVQFRDPFSTKIVDGVMVDDYLCEEYGIFCELNFPTCLTFVLPQNSKAAVSFLFTQLSNLQAQRFLQGKNSFAEDVMSTGFQSISFKKAESQLLHSSKTTVYLDYEDAELKQKLLGKVSAETILIYPPGVPFIIRGEEVTEVHYNSLRRFQSMLKLNQLPTGCYLQGNSDESLLQLEIFSE